MAEAMIDDTTPAEGPGPEGRPPPRWTSVAGGIGAALLIASLGEALAELGDKRRLGGIIIGLLFQALGVLLLLLNRNRRTATAGVGLTAVGLVPLLVFLFVDVDNPSTTINSVGDFTRTATLILLAAAVIWFVAYRFGPSKGYAIYLAGALVALWLVAVVQIVEQPIAQIGSYWNTTYTTYDSGYPTEIDEEAYAEAERELDDCLDEGVLDEDTCFENYDAAFQAEWFNSDDGTGYSDVGDPSPDYPEVDDPSTKLGLVSLVFGVGYLALAALGDRRGERRRSTALLAAAIPILWLAVSFLANDLRQGGTAVAAIALGAAAIWIGTEAAAPEGRRFTSWVGGAAVIGGCLALVDLMAGDNRKVATGVLLALGLAITFAARQFDPEAPDPQPADGPDPTTGPFSSGPWGSAQAAEPAQIASTGEIDPWAPQPGAAPQPATPDPWDPSPGAQAPAAPPTTPTIDGAPWAPPADNPTPPADGSSF